MINLGGFDKYFPTTIAVASFRSQKQLMYHWNSECAPKGRATWHRVKGWGLSTGKSQRTEHYTLLLRNRGPAIITSDYFELPKAYLYCMTSLSQVCCPLGSGALFLLSVVSSPLPNPRPWETHREQMEQTPCTRRCAGSAAQRLHWNTTVRN